MGCVLKPLHQDGYWPSSSTPSWQFITPSSSFHSLYSAASGCPSLSEARLKEQKLKCLRGLRPYQLSGQWQPRAECHVDWTMALSRKPPWGTTPDVGLDSPSCLLGKLPHLLPLPLDPKDVGGKVPPDASSQVTSFDHLACDKLTYLSQHQLVVMQVCSTAPFSPGSTFRMFQLERGFCIHVCEPPNLQRIHRNLLH